MIRPGRCRVVVSLLGALLRAAATIGSALAAGNALANASVATSPSWKVDETGAGALNVVSCSNRHFCVAVGTSTGTDEVVEFNGTSWGTARQLEKYAGEVVSLSCPTVGWCVALTDLAGAAILHHGRWSHLTTIDPNPGPPYPSMATAVSCTSSRFCLAVDAQGNAETYNGTSWTEPQRIDHDFPPNDVSCTSAKRCIAVDGGGRVVQFDDGRWSDPEPVDTTALTTISCVGAEFCVATDLLGRAVVLTRSGWSHPTEVDSRAATPIAVSCAQRERCVAVDSSGRVLTLTGKAWTEPQVADVSSAIVSALIDVSCPSHPGSFCAAVDSSGNALMTNNVGANH